MFTGFLRALEYYHGILFLTTNRVGSFDDAFISRIHVKLYYQDFTESQRQQVWQTFIDRLAQDRGDYMRLNIDAKEYLRSSHVKAMKWNGREIRNGKFKALNFLNKLSYSRILTVFAQASRQLLRLLNMMAKKMKRARYY